MPRPIPSLTVLLATASLAVAQGGDKPKEGLFQGKTSSVSFKPGQGITFDGGDEFGLNLSSWFQATWSFAANDRNTDGVNAIPDVHTFDVDHARLTLSGHAFDRDLHFKLSLETVEEQPVKDAWVQWTCGRGHLGELGLRFGQSKTYFGLESTGTGRARFFVDASAATRTFANSRSRGAWLHGSHVENKLRWNLGAQNTDVAAGVESTLADAGEETSNGDNKLNYLANLSFEPLGDMTGGKGTEAYEQGDLNGTPELRLHFGGGVQFGNNINMGNGYDVGTTAFNLNAAGKVQGFGFLAEYFLRTDDQEAPGAPDFDSSGYAVQVDYTLPKTGDSPLQWGFGARYAGIDLPNDATTSLVAMQGAGDHLGDRPGTCNEVTFGVNAFYHGHAAKTQFAYTLQKVSPDTGTDATNHILAVSFQLLF